MPRILIICGSKSDEHIAKKTTGVLDDNGVSYQLEYASAHREPDRVRAIVEVTDAEVIIAIAGLSAALPGFIASLTDRPVIGVPVSAKLGGLDALLSIAQMPKGVPVATVGIDNGQNAAHLALRILNLGKRKSKQVPRTYAEAGVDDDAILRGLKILGKFVKESFKGHTVMQDFGHYANTVKIDDHTCLALSTDGVGSKILVAEMMEKFDTIGIDCVAMNVNDLICIGAMPVGFVDYLAVEHPLKDTILEQIGRGLLEGCRQAGVPILGGETAVLPEMIRGAGSTGVDLAGTAVGIADCDELIDGRAIQDGDIILGVESNGIHSNGFTLARKVLLSHYSLENRLGKNQLGEELLRPTRIYVPHFKALKRAGVKIHGIAHITGSGFKKILRLGNFEFNIEGLPPTQKIFELIQQLGSISDTEMFSTFNMGIGLIVVVDPKDADRARKTLMQHDTTYELGRVKASDRGRVVIKQKDVIFE